MSAALDRLRDEACQTLFPPTTLGAAIARMGFVQADPIRAPARAQDLILRHRVRGYRAGDLERRFARLGLEEDFLHAYGFMPRAVRDLLHPRPDPAQGGGPHVPEALAAEVLAFVRASGAVHPAALEARFGAERATNNWGGFSKATTRALESLRHYGLLRVVRREGGIRVYAAAAPPPGRDAPGLDAIGPDAYGLDAPERARRLVLLVARVLAPASATGLRGALALMKHRNPGLGAMAPVVEGLVASGALAREEVEGQLYLRPAPAAPAPPPRRREVRLLAPFDPLVWDRRRFEHLWGWAYRFEAYTPPGRRTMGYYAMPLLWGDQVIGWGNVSLPGGRVRVEIGTVGPPPRSPAFRRALEAETARLQRFLGSPDQAPRDDPAQEEDP